MHQYQQTYDLPFAKSFQRKPPSTNYPLPYFYTQETKEQQFDLPMQISHNPYNQNRKNQQNHPKYSKNTNQSISKCAITQISNKDQEQYASDIAPICQQLFDLDDDNFFKDFQLPKILAPNGVITQATFKPNQLNQYLSNEDSNKENNKIKSLLELNVFNNSKQNKKKIIGKENGTKSSINLIQRQKINNNNNTQGKTKYQRILQQFFKLPTKRNHIDHKLHIEKIPNYKIQHLQDYNKQQQEDQKMNKYRLLMDKCPENIKKVRSKTINHCKSERGIHLNSRTINQNKSSRLKKTMSQQRFDKTNHPKQKQMIQKWLKMTFDQRQLKTLQNRKQKQNNGKLNNLKKQIQNCTFKPQITQLKIRPKQITSGSYAKIYYEKVKKRFC